MATATGELVLPTAESRYLVGMTFNQWITVTGLNSSVENRKAFDACKANGYARIAQERKAGWLHKAIERAVIVRGELLIEQGEINRRGASTEHDIRLGKIALQKKEQAAAKRALLNGLAVERAESVITIVQAEKAENEAKAIAKAKDEADALELAASTHTGEQ